MLGLLHCLEEAVFFLFCFCETTARRGDTLQVLPRANEFDGLCETMCNEVVKGHINQQLGVQVIRDSCCPFASLIVLVKKKNSSLQLCVDYNLTAGPEKMHTHFTESLNVRTGAHWFSTNDLASSYSQVPVAEA